MDATTTKSIRIKYDVIIIYHRMVKIQISRLFTANSTKISKDDSLADCLSSKSEPNLMDPAAPASRLSLGKISSTKPSKFLESMCSLKTFKSKDLEIKF